MMKEAFFKSIIGIGQRLPVSVRMGLTQSPRFAWIRRFSQIPTNNSSVVMTLNAPLAGYQMRLDINGGHRRFALGTYEPQIAALIRSRVPKSGTAIDIGANIGYFTLLMADCVGELGKVIAFEPAPAVYARLCENLRLNRCQWVQAECIAVTDTNYQSRMRSQTDGTLSFTGQLAEDGDLIVSATTLDSYVFQASNLKRLDFVKIDVEGAEDHVARGMVQALTALHPEVVVEIHRNDGQESEFLALLSRLGYQLYRLTGNQWMPCDILAYTGHVFAVHNL